LGENEAVIEIKPIDDSEIIDKLSDSLLSSGIQAGDVFFDNVSEGTSSGFGTNIQHHLEMLEKTDFIRISPDSNQCKISVKLTPSRTFKFVDCYKYKSLVISASGRDYTSHTAYGDIDIGTILYRRDEKINNKIDIWRVVKHVHDFASNFWAVAELVASYPRDAEKIRDMYPAFYNEFCIPSVEFNRRKELRNVESIPYLKDEQQVGDGILYCPLDASTHEFSIAMGEHFHFSMESCKGMAHYAKGNGKIRVSGHPTLVSLVVCAETRRFRFVYYIITGYVMHESLYYAQANFNRASKWLDTLDSVAAYNQKDTGHKDKSMDSNAIAHASLLLYRNLIQPIKLERKQMGVNLLEPIMVQNASETHAE
jgi:hypothetical protein